MEVAIFSVFVLSVDPSLSTPSFKGHSFVFPHQYIVFSLQAFNHQHYVILQASYLLGYKYLHSPSLAIAHSELYYIVCLRQNKEYIILMILKIYEPINTLNINPL